MTFNFATASQIFFGRGTISKVPELVENYGNKILLVTGKNQGRAKPLTDRLPASVQVVFFHVNAEPATTTIDQGVKLARENQCEAIVGFGGGSVIDSAKAIAALTPNAGELLDYLEVIGKGKKLEEKPLPFIAIPTTAGTGAEASKNSVIYSAEHKVKVSLRSQLMFADVAVIDPELTLSVPPEVTAITGMDALTHLLETFVSCQANTFIDNFGREGMQRVSRSLLKAYENGSNLEAREDMAYAALLGGMALANVKLGAVHGFAGPMGGMVPIPHGAVCARLLPAVMEANLKSAKSQNLKYIISKYDEVAQLLTGESNARSEEGVQWAQQMVEKLNIPSLSAFGLTPSDFPVLVEKAKKASSMKGNPVVLSDESLMLILEKSI